MASIGHHLFVGLCFFRVFAMLRVCCALYTPGENVEGSQQGDFYTSGRGEGGLACCGSLARPQGVASRLMTVAVTTAVLDTAPFCTNSAFSFRVIRLVNFRFKNKKCRSIDTQVHTSCDIQGSVEAHLCVLCAILALSGKQDHVMCFYCLIKPRVFCCEVCLPQYASV